MHRRKIFSLVALVLTGGALGGGCASLALNDGGMQCIGPQCQNLDGGARDQYVHDVVVPDQGTGGEGGYVNPLCGHGSCVPDDTHACMGEAGQPDGGVDAGVAPDAATPAPHDAGAPTDGASAPEDGGSPLRGCHVRRLGTKPVAVCEPAGNGNDGDACISSEDCAPGFGCVDDSGVGVCRQFCCSGNDSCSPDHFCTDRQLKDDDSLQVPVCVLPDDCNLAQPWPCSEANPEDCTCKDPSTACIVVGHGLTSCITPPGTGKDGDPCPCAWGYVCSQAQNTCLRICNLGTTQPCPAPYLCQSSPFMPASFGVCAGTSLDASTP
jgi:hypothetical protein